MYDVNKMSKISKKYKIPVIEDGAQSFGAKFGNKNSCNSSLIGTTSFFPTKPLGCYGDGGAIFTNNKKIATICKQIRVHGQKKKHDYVRLGINGRMDTLQCAIILEKIKLFKKEIELRNNIANVYSRFLKKISNSKLSIIKKNEKNYNVWAQYTIIVKKNLRDKLKKYLWEYKIPSAIYYPVSLNKLKIFETDENCPNSEKLASQVLSLPMHPYLKFKDQYKIISKINNFFK